MPEGQVLELAGLTKRFGAVSAVDSLDARVEPGLVTGFLGPNGAGKTTSLRMLLGLVRPTSGTATIGGKRYADLASPLQTVGAALEASSFHPGRSAANHLKVYARAASLPTSRIDEVLGLVGLADVAGRRVGGFSLGMRQRLGLATALLGDPGVLVLDEPTNGLDPEGIRWMRSLLRHLAEEGRTVLISSHLLAEVQQTVDALLIISHGRLVFQGGVEDLADPDEYATVVDAPDRAALSALLDERGIPYQLLRNGFTIRHLEPVEIGALAAGAGIALSHLQSKGASLEDIFLELVSGVRVHASAGGTTVAAPTPDPGLPDAAIPDAVTPAPAAESLPTAAPVDPAASPVDDVAAAEPATSTDLVTIPAPARGARVEPPSEASRSEDPRPSYSVASTGVIDVVPPTPAQDGGTAPEGAATDSAATDSTEVSR
ncbi:MULTISPECIES: ABC transporter ATP-binding protein [Microbacterium]|uniref:ABC transporter ATP-binding protein n=1 Tax=Microbacterium TaxID=33882 RepID=UPI0027852EC7|nr:MULTISPECIES: ABC transporter ATP-binding protein [Microbacterium]MDQ1075336.1 ABC-2 type transport system ATP-binding protein [Microbacterium sp. SORGH_AS_0969]MDQ1115567.1 ABC-2 type transport system ATP-binding protein [Microbacterium testaceum]